jgi:hypothetical protein
MAKSSQPNTEVLDSMLAAGREGGEMVVDKGDPQSIHLLDFRTMELS